MVRKQISFVIVLGLLLSACHRATPTVEQVTITFATQGIYQSDSTLQSLAEAFHRQNPTITVQIVKLPDTVWTGDDLSSLASSADAVINFIDRTRLAQNSAYFSDLTPFLEGDPSFQPDDFWPGLLTACQDAEGRMTGIPMSVIPLFIYYTLEAFDHAGIQYPTPGWTWDDFQHDVTALSHTQAGQADFGFVDSTGFLASVLAQLVDGYLSNANGVIESASIKALLQSYLDLARSDRLFPFTGSDDNRTRLFQGKAPAMWIGGLADRSPVNPDRTASQSYGLAPFPLADDGSVTHTTPQLPICGFVSSGSDHKREAWTWLNFLTHQELGSTLNINNQLPARISIANETHVWDDFSAQTVTAIRSSLAQGWYGSRNPATLQQIGEVLATAITEQADLDRLLAQLSGAPIPDTPTPNVVTPVVVATAQPAHDNSGDVVTINYSPPPMPPFDTTFQKLAEEFHRLHPEIIVNVSTDSNCIGGSVSSCIDLNVDCFTANLFGSSVGNYENDLYNLDPFLGSSDPSLLDDFYPGLINSFTVDGKLYALPATARMPLLYYNADILAQKGLNPPSSAWTMNDFLSMATKASSGGGLGVWTLDNLQAEATAGPSGKVDQVFGATNVDTILLDFLAKGWVDYSVDPPVVNLDKPQVLNALKQVTGLIQDGVVLYSNNLQPLAVSDIILSGRVAFWFSDRDLSSSFSQFPSRIKIGAAPVPEELEVVEEMGVGTLRAMEGHFISRKTKNPQACWQWISYLSENPNSFLGVPVRRSVVESKGWEARVGPETAAVYREALSMTSIINETAYSDYWEAYYYSLSFMFHKTIGKVLNGSDPQVVIADEQRAFDTYLACIAPLNLSDTSVTDVSNQVADCAQKADPWSDLQMWP